jgi:hypothetical protein
MNRAIFALLMLFDSDLALDPNVRSAFVAMMKDTRYGFSHMEEAGFVVQQPDGELGFVRWPSSGVPDTAFWIGDFPRGTIAIAHTHPNMMPLPSNLDAATARRTRMPVYVITPNAIVKTRGASPEVVVRGDW